MVPKCGKSHVVLSAANSLITHNSLLGYVSCNGVSTKLCSLIAKARQRIFKDRLGKYELQKQNIISFPSVNLHHIKM